MKARLAAIAIFAGLVLASMASPAQAFNESQPFTKTSSLTCNKNYTPCVPNESDVDCKELSGQVTVKGDDVYRLDEDGDGIGCESDEEENSQPAQNDNTDDNASGNEEGTDSNRLPVTGTKETVLVALGVFLIIGGIASAYFFRRRRIKFVA